MTPQLSFHIAVTATGYVLLRYVAQFCNHIYKFITHGDMAQRSGIQDILHYVALRM